MSVRNGIAAQRGRIKHYGSQRSLESYRDLVVVLLQKELRVRYTNKVLGYFWSIANPLSSALIYYIAFGLIMQVRERDYPLLLISGLFPWQWLSNVVCSSPNLFVGSASIIKKVNFPREIVPLCASLNHAVHYLASLPIIALFLFLFDKPFHLSWLYGLPLLLIVQFLMGYGLALALSSINLFFRDLDRLINIIMHFLLFLSPVLYTIDRFPPDYRVVVLALNPAAALLANWRQLILEGTLNPTYLLISVAFAASFLALGHFIYKQLSWKFAELI